MDVDHGTVQPLQKLFGDAAAQPVIPIFINSVATPLGPLRRVRALGAAVGTYLATLDKRVLVIGSGGLSHDPPVPTLATAPPAALGRIVHGEPMTPEQRQARQVAVMEAARQLRARRRARCSRSIRSGITRSWKSFDSDRLAEVDGWSNSWIDARGGPLRARNPHVGRGIRGAGRARPLRDRAPLLPRGARADRRIRRQDGGIRPHDNRRIRPHRRRARHRLRRRRHDRRTRRRCVRSRHARRREVAAVRRFHRAVGRRHLGAGCAVATQGGLRSRPRRACSTI